MANPLLRSVVITPVNTNVSLLSLLQALDQNIFPRCQYVQIQVAITEGGATVRIVNKDSGSDTDCGAELVASQAYTIGPSELNTINLENIFLRSDVDNTRCNIALVVK